MKKVIMSFIVLFASAAMASGKLSVQVNSYEQGESFRPQVGIAIYEKLLSVGDVKTAFNSWSGVGEQPRSVAKDVQWLTTKNQIDISFGKWTLSPGVQVFYLRTFDKTESLGFAKLSYQLW